MSTAPVSKGMLEITIVERGNLESANNVTLSCMVEGESGTGILKIVDEGARVTGGQVLVELDSSRLKNDLTSQQIKVEEASASRTQAEEELKIQDSQNQSDIADAELKLEIAKLDLEKYEDDRGEYTQKENEQKGQVQIAQEDLTRSIEKLRYQERMIAKGYATQTELDADRIAEKKARIALAAAEEKLHVLQNFERKRQLSELRANVKDYERELVRVKQKAANAMVQKQADFKAKDLTFTVEKEKYEKLQRQIEACIIKAPRDGLVVYANNRSGGFRGASNEPLIYEGAKVRERQAIINLPDITRMQVNARIHESKISMVRDGLPVTVHVDARPGEVFNGVVDSVSTVPMSANWPNVNLKEYLCYIKLTDSVEKVSALKPGLTAEVEIVIDRADGVLMAPVQSFVERGGQQFAFIQREDGTIERRKVKVGRSSEDKTEVLEGLEDGDRVVQTPRTTIAKDVQKLEEEIPAVSAQQQAEAATKGTLPPVPKPPAPGASGAGGPPAGAGAGGAGGPPGGAPGAGGRGPGGGGANRDPAESFARMDANGDGKIVADEIPEQARQFMKIEAMDKNGDKAVDKEEFIKAMEEFRKRFQQGGGGGAGGPGA
ncbi:MAG: HlyD family efflux transporter periplasmic adaptor subunit [Planctomycetaceae bacterium]